MKKRADWYTKGRIEQDVKTLVEDRFAAAQAEARELAAAQQRWRNQRLGRVQPVQMDGLFIAKEVAPGTLVLGFREEAGDSTYGVQLISFNKGARTPSDHGTSPFIGKYVRVTIEELV